MTRKRSSKAGKKGQPGRLRIVAGNWRSRLLEIADVDGLRPTSERIRETLFNWLVPHIHGARCLDLFAGTGALGLEALSRGAASVDFVEQSPLAAKTLRRNIEILSAEEATVHQMDAFAYLRARRSDAFDIVFLDPPFAANALDELCRLLDGCSLLIPGALIYTEEDRHRPRIELPTNWQLLKSANAGNVRYSLVQVGDRSHKGGKG
jgi:16S rRNA (guanine966-N2)-methyltransferase